MDNTEYDIILMGFGISSFCFLLYLYNNKLIEKHKILILEKSNSACINSLNYKNINSNSTLRSLLEPFRVKIFRQALQKVDANCELDKYINLSDYNKIITSLVKIFLNAIQQYDNIKIIFKHKVNNITHNVDKIKVDNYFAKTCIIGLGAKQDIDYLIEKDINNILQNKLDRCVLPHRIFNDDVNFDSFVGKKIAIIGSSHSSLSVVDSILSKKVNCKEISLLCRNDFKVHFETPEQAKNAGHNFGKDDICNETNSVNRFNGLRENSKKIYMNLNNYGIKKVCNSIISCADYDIIIPCWGYYKFLPKINNKTHKFLIDSNNNFELTIKNKHYENIFLLGLNSRPKIKISQKSFKESVDGVWIYYNLICDQLYKSILNKLIK